MKTARLSANRSVKPLRNAAALSPKSKAGDRAGGTGSMDAVIGAVTRSQAVAVLDADGAWLETNSVFQRVTGYSAEELAGHHHRMLLERTDSMGRG